ncbi:MAG TPA: 4-hydroxythreonine-4-phosphate dehydrogenase PdxA [Idiomarina baltica]|uniref:4-hydroxythreonine-4-phosphate dehydrogenase n=1 Tax=Idiomarina baltica TaxID=190892 RepID=A0A348WNT7_9GAMM|nr:MULTISPECIES: 4-hydroxythreonine-4-phosphate dehydrogenase PdxA [Idiomarina]KXS36168.1 MAG: 4-hydroxythreonine-4-phosphate dehydrogenase [Idiomarina sp. T82-3]MBL74790.1 4-hydroxythreonine-4-phosphate dehydrogenase PdxA [Idiomarinaceae bacterium]MEC8925700.1 4-hydroxythreonine-4-phosphate dehydrogenase PdxA [Pseudomonadota bacterium]HAR56199.1 4-hydroxythreonine-4-phosphate dehydrogenase PdxA [Idiomarina baltica]|tara:strand:- start:3817 stop:4803 length:987 start_codon:yes stop_codon:yes gene_type:complete
MRPLLAFTPGEPAGVGPDLAVMMAQQHWQADIVAIADAGLLKQRATELNLPLELIPYEGARPQSPMQPGQLLIKHVPLAETAIAGALNVANGQYVVETLSIASDGNLSGEFDAIVTGPVHKGIINEAGVAFSGHTEFFANKADCPDVVMMLATEGLRVALVTTHIPLAYVSKAITPERLEKIITILDADLRQKFGEEQPNILVCGLNPHAGEGGHLGHEEEAIIAPVIRSLQTRGMTVSGPYPADTVFQPKYLESASAVVAMYHDQGLPVLKYKGFGKAVNITLGLPYIRTSVDHGTALDMAGSPAINSGSCQLAIKTAIDMVNNSKL